MYALHTLTMVSKVIQILKYLVTYHGFINSLDCSVPSVYSINYRRKIQNIYIL